MAPEGREPGGEARAVLLVNLGSPTEPSPAAVRRFLRPFLSDQRVVELPRWLWRPLLSVVVLPLRGKRVAHAYGSIWQEGESPLRLYLKRLTAACREQWTAGPNPEIDRPGRLAFAVTYGEPGIAAALDSLQATGARTISVLPLYPQYSATTTAAVFDQVAAWIRSRRDLPSLHLVRDYHDHPAYTAALAQQVKSHWAQHGRPAALVFSYHGIPEANVKRGDPYAEQCRRTTELVCAQLDTEGIEVLQVFQSRFGAAKWLQPYADEVLQALPARGVRRVQVLSPSFSLDCLETKEEINIGYRQDFLQAGGEAFEYIPALNDTAAHVEVLRQVVRDRG